MSVMGKLLEINDELVRVLAECAELRKEQTKLQDICADGGRRITELQAELRKACAERDEAVERAGRLQAELDATRKQLQEVLYETENAEPQPVKVQEGGLLRDVSHYTEMAEVDTDTDDAPAEPVKVQEGWWSQRGYGEVYVRPTSSSPDNEPKRAKGFVWSDGARLYMDNGRHSKDGQTPHDLVKFLGKHLKATNQKADDAQPQPVQEVTLSAYVVGDTVSPEALRIVWATKEWIEQSKFGIVHPMKDVMFLDQDRFTPEQFSLTLMLSK